MSSSRSGINILGIESSCDDTGVAIVNQNGHILSNCIDSQLKRHLDLGGVIPVVAKDLHMDSIDRVALEAFRESKLGSVKDDIDAIAVTTRPGMQFSLKVGFNYAKKLAQKYSKPLIPIHHMQAHSLMPLMLHRSIKFPYLTLLLSGGHCLLAIVKRYNEFSIVGTTIDEAPGDFLDKFARKYRLRHLGPPFDRISGGAAIELLAKREGADRFKYFSQEKIVPMMRYRNCNFSFSGYRAVFEVLDPIVEDLRFRGKEDELLMELSHACASLQRIILIQIAKKLQRAYLFYKMHWRYANEDAYLSTNQSSKHLCFNVRDINEATDIVISGGVAANSYLLDGIKLACKECIDPDLNVYSPSKGLCSDNGLMIAWNGLLRYKDYLDNKQSFATKNLGDSVILDNQNMNTFDIETKSPIGLDLSKQVELKNFQVSRFKNREFKLNS